MDNNLLFILCLFAVLSVINVCIDRYRIKQLSLEHEKTFNVLNHKIQSVITTSERNQRMLDQVTSNYLNQLDSLTLQLKNAKERAAIAESKLHSLKKKQGTNRVSM